MRTFVFFKNNKQFDYRCIDLNLCIYSLEHQKQFWCSDIFQFNSRHVSWITFVTKQIYVLIGTCVDFIRSYRCSWNKDIPHQFGWRISKMVGPKKQDFLAKNQHTQRIFFSKSVDEFIKSKINWIFFKKT